MCLYTTLAGMGLLKPSNALHIVCVPLEGRDRTHSARHVEPSHCSKFSFFGRTSQIGAIVSDVIRTTVCSQLCQT